MFPVAELSNLNNCDLLFLDDVCLSEDNLLGENKNMADFDLIEGTPLSETNILSEDWLSGTFQLDDITEKPGFNQSGEFIVSYPGYLSTSHSICSGSVEDSSTDIFGASSSVDEPLQTERVSSEEIYSFSDDTRKQLDTEHAKSSVVSENEEASLEQNLKDVYHLAGKKYLQMREKNNIASQRSRKLRKQKNMEMIGKLKKLEVENKQLLLLATKLERERDALQRQLLKAISKK